MLIRISLIVAILAAIAAGTLNVLQVRDKITTLITQRDTEKHDKETALADLSSTKKDLAKTKNDLAQTQQELSDTKTERDTAVATASKQTKLADELANKLTKSNQERDDANTQLGAYKATQLTPDEVLKLNKNLKSARGAIEAMQEENTVLLRKNVQLQTHLNEFIGTNTVVELPAGLRGKILVVDPKWDFVVLNVGEEQGVLANGELLVSREGKLVAKVIVRSMEKDRCIANVVPGWKLGELIEGDEVTPAHPAS